MKLLRRVNIRYIASSLLIMLTLGTVLNYIILKVIAEQLDEKIEHTYNRITKQIEKTGEFCSVPPYIDIKKVDHNDETFNYSDTRKDGEDFRQLTSIKMINGSCYRIVVRESIIESDDLFETIAMIILITFLIMVSSLILVNRYISRSIWLPFYNNLDQFKKFSLKNREPLKLSETDISEFNDLNSVIKSLTEKIASDYQSLKQFSEDASHEFQSPLAIIKSKLEGLTNHPGLNKTQSDQIQSIYAAVHRLSRLSKDLILLNKIENKQFSETVLINLNNAIESKLEDFRELINLKDISCTTSFTGDLTLAMNPALSDILISNLMSNAINHSPKNGNITLEINENTLKFKNSGLVPIANPQNIYNRFSKEDPSSRSVGLGLAIVKKICDMHSIEIFYSFSEEMHCFKLVFQL